jgi:endonuclease III-like uncharacterized protein
MKTVWHDLVVSMLSVYNYTLEKVDAYSEGLEKQGLFEPDKIKKMSHEEIFAALEKSGYIRGNLNAIFTERVQGLGEYVDKKGKKYCESILKTKDKEAITTLLKPIKGVGPKVIENYFELRDLDGQ